MTIPNFKYFFNNKSKRVDIVLHGSSQGMDSPLIEKIVQHCRKAGDSVLAFNFPYMERGEEKWSGPELKKELEALKSVMEYCQVERFESIRFIGKSLGGVVASYYLKSLKEADAKVTKYSIVVLGYIAGTTDLKGFSGSITIIQGEKDKFGGIGVVKKDLKEASSKDIKYFEVAGADHSYRDPDTKEPKYEDVAVRFIQEDQ